ncbi:MAG: DUF1080 domain-containing protein [Planctomycetota bacterium]|nr:MAG: DUF1080 domain-containing protein [Planctomycetota bacterium]
MQFTKRSRTATTILLSLALFSAWEAYADHHKGHKSYTDPEKADEDFAYQGEYLGATSHEGEKKVLAVQIIALGNHKFRARGFTGGLPGAGWDGEQGEQIEGTLVDGFLTFASDHGTGVVRDGAMAVIDAEGNQIAVLKKVHRESPTLGMKPPEGAVVLFDGSGVENWVRHRKGGPAEMTEDGLLTQGSNSKQEFGDHTLHVEFRLPYMPTARGQARGNSGCYLQGRYEVQMLDSFGLEGLDNECGGLYSVSRPSVNMCFPPLSWQTYDIDFTAPRFDADGNKTSNARITVRHNGVVIHDDVEIPRGTPAGVAGEGPTRGVVHLQDHGNPVRYRNIWVVEKK